MSIFAASIIDLLHLNQAFQLHALFILFLTQLGNVLVEVIQQILNSLNYLRVFVVSTLDPLHLRETLLVAFLDKILVLLRLSVRFSEKLEELLLLYINFFVLFLNLLSYSQHLQLSIDQVEMRAETLLNISLANGFLLSFLLMVVQVCALPAGVRFH